MSSNHDPHNSGVFVLGTAVLTVRPERRTAPPTEAELFRDELTRLAGTKTRRPGLFGRLRSGTGRARRRPVPTREPVGSRS
ncbi:hypothetical protein [Microlunatus speluncae]|uniref:hypothetical protein n=1 Tax=Microlunatus speluncae TaxID=2594267 RepID=UPI0012662CF5|nr:hypothetical protein [Microlunatus speluncae]